jgi:DNA invertase Pin-like site-specific DNA recombinase
MHFNLNYRRLCMGLRIKSAHTPRRWLPTDQSLCIGRHTHGMTMGGQGIFHNMHDARQVANFLLDHADTFTVTRLDRLARSVLDLHQIVERLSAKGCGLRVVQQAGVDTTSSTGKLTLAVLAAVAEFETEIRKERQRDSIARAKEAGVYKGRRATIAVDRVRELHAAGMRPVDIARTLSIGRASVYRLLKVHPPQA